MDAVYTHQLQAALQAECSTVAQNLMTMPHRIIAQLLATPEAEVGQSFKLIRSIRGAGNANGQIKQQDETIRSLKRQLLQADAEIKDYQAKEHTLRDIVLENTIGDKINDQDMIRKFTDLWQQIQSIVGSKTLKFDQLHKTIPSGLSQSSTKFYSEFIRLAQKDRASALKANIFSILHERILDKPFLAQRVWLVKVLKALNWVWLL
ncbi:hypothetical protein ACCO45_010047 [Purpureocillium lilacinum]|uniref:Uncharacterized protein n=1 Tax=Purpureocillium lilacinum TaxID=33203 RepID=A0ACC4DDW1_PURLI